MAMIFALKEMKEAGKLKGLNAVLLMEVQPFLFLLCEPGAARARPFAIPPSPTTNTLRVCSLHCPLSLTYHARPPLL